MHTKALFCLCLAVVGLLLGSCMTSDEVGRIASGVFDETKPAGPLPPLPFVSDGCSCWPDGDWVECCVRHDLAYWVGGTREQRKAADLDLKHCVAEERGHPFMGYAMYLGVRPGGVWWLPTPFRWGFGWDYPKHGPPGTRY